MVSALQSNVFRIVLAVRRSKSCLLALSHRSPSEVVADIKGAAGHSRSCRAQRCSSVRGRATNYAGSALIATTSSGRSGNPRYPAGSAEVNEQYPAHRLILPPRAEAHASSPGSAIKRHQAGKVCSGLRSNYWGFLCADRTGRIEVPTSVDRGSRSILDIGNAQTGRNWDRWAHRHTTDGDTRASSALWDCQLTRSAAASAMAPVDTLCMCSISRSTSLLCSFATQRRSLFHGRLAT